MLDISSIWPKLFLGNSVMVVGIFDENIQVLWVNKEKSEVKQTRHMVFESLDTFAVSQEAVSSLLPILFCVNNKNVIFEQNPEAVAVFDSNEFLIQKSEDFDFYSVIRKSQVEAYLSKIPALRHSVCGIYLGPTEALNWVTPLEIQQPYFLGAHCFSLENETFKVSNNQSDDSVVLDNESYTPDQLLLFLTSFGFLINGAGTSELPEVKDNVKESAFSALLSKVVMYGGILLFAIFLISTGLYFYYEAENEKLSESYYEQNVLQKKADFYQSEISSIEKILDTDSRYPVFSRLSNDLAERVPKSISLKEMTVFPVDMADMKRRKRIDRPSSVQVIGQSRSMKEVSSWVTEIKDLAWVSDISKNEITKTEAGYLIKITVLVGDVE